MEERKLDVPEALRVLRSIGGERWVSVEDLVELTRLSDKWVREGLSRLELTGEVSTKEGPRGTRLYRLNPADETTDSSRDDISRWQNVLGHGSAGHRSDGIVEIGGRVTAKQEPYEPPPIPALRELWDRRPQIRKILLKTDTTELREIYDHLDSKRRNDPDGNPFGAVKIFARNGLIDGSVRKVPIKNVVMIGTAASAEAHIFRFRFGPVSIPVKFGLTTACGIIHQIEDDKVNTDTLQEVKIPKRLTPDRVDEDLDRTDFPGMSKLVKESFHYELDNEALDYALPLLKESLQYKADLESLQRAEGIRSRKPLLFLLRSGSLTPQEQHPFDLKDSRKEKVLQATFNAYIRLRDRIIGQGSGTFVFGVLPNTEPRRAIYREIIDELLKRKLPGWVSGRMNTLDDNDVLGLLLDRGEFTQVARKNPMEDIIQSIGLARIRTVLGTALYNQYESNRKLSKTYQFFMGFGDGKALRFDCPVLQETTDEGPAIRDIAAPIIFSSSSAVGESEGTRPRIITYAQTLSKRHLAEMA